MQLSAAPGSENCDENQYLSPNGNFDWTEGRCSNPSPMGVAIGAATQGPKCVCYPGHVRIGHTNRGCVEEKDCGEISKKLGDVAISLTH
jgi:hypothetical protein